MLKADLMNMRRRWFGVSVETVIRHCRSLGMRETDVVEIADLVHKAQAGRRLVPQRTYRDFHFAMKLDDQSAVEALPEW